MNFASSLTAKDMSGRVQFDRYMHLPTIAQYGSCAAVSRSSSVLGHMSVVRRKSGQGVFTALQFSILKSDKICVVYCSWSIISSLHSRQRRIRQPRSHSVSPPSVMANFSWICEVVRSDSDFELEAMRRSSTLEAEMVRAEAVFRMYTLQSNSHRVNPRDEYAS